MHEFKGTWLCEMVPRKPSFVSEIGFTQGWETGNSCHSSPWVMLAEADGFQSLETLSRVTVCHPLFK